MADSKPRNPKTIIGTLPTDIAITLHPELLDNCYRIWSMRDFQGLPPDPNEVQYLDNDYLQQVFKWGAIVRYVEDEPRRKREYGI